MNTPSTKSAREMPTIEQNLPAPVRPISFVCVHYSDEFDHNILISDCVHSDLNEFIVVDNRDNSRYQTLGQAMNAGINQAQHEIIVVVHEDVVFLSGWQALFEKSLNELEKENADWMFLGVVGWHNNKLIGCCGDPRGVYNPDWKDSYAEIDRVDEQLMVFRKSTSLRPDPNLPTIHNYGSDLIRQAEILRAKCYVVRAPTVHKYADSTGNITQSPMDSAKIQNRNNIIYKLHKYCSDEYLYLKWPSYHPNYNSEHANIDITEQQKMIIESPTIFVGKKEALDKHIHKLSMAMQIETEKEQLRKINDFENTNLKASIIKAIFRKFQCPSNIQQQIAPDEIKQSAFTFLNDKSWPISWGFAFEESIYIQDILQIAFPNASFIVLSDSQNDESPTFPDNYFDNELGRTLINEAVRQRYDTPTSTRKLEAAEKSTILNQHILDIKETLKKNPSESYRYISIG